MSALIKKQYNFSLRCANGLFMMRILVFTLYIICVHRL